MEESFQVDDNWILKSVLVSQEMASSSEWPKPYPSAVTQSSVQGVSGHRIDAMLFIEYKCIIYLFDKDLLNT